MPSPQKRLSALLDSLSDNRSIAFICLMTIAVVLLVFSVRLMFIPDKMDPSAQQIALPVVGCGVQLKSGDVSFDMDSISKMEVDSDDNSIVLYFKNGVALVISFSNQQLLIRGIETLQTSATKSQCQHFIDKFMKNDNNQDSL